MSSKEKDKEKPPKSKSKNMNSTTSNSNSKDKGKQIMAKSSTKKIPKNYAFPVQTFQGIALDMSRSKPLTLTQKFFRQILLKRMKNM